MRTLLRLPAILAAVFVLSLSIVAGASTAHADDYFTNVATWLENGHNVYEDVSAVPHITDGQVQKLEDEIASTQTQTSIYLVLVSDDKTSGIAASELPARVHNALDAKGVYAVSSKYGFYAQAFDVPKEVADNAPRLAYDAANDKTTRSNGEVVPYKVFSTYVHSVDAIHVSHPAARNHSSAHAARPMVTTADSSNGHIWLLVTVGVIVLIVLALILTWIFASKRDDDYDAAYYGDMPRDNGPDQVDRSYNSNDDYGNGPQDTPRRTATGNDRPTGWSSQPQVQQHQPQLVQSTNNNLYFGGGWSGGVFYGPGYYSDPFWNFMVMESLLDHNQGVFDRDGYNQGFTDGVRHEDSSGGQTDQTSTSDSSGGDSWGGTSSDSSDTSSSDSGGGYDSNSSGGDSWGGSSSSDSGGSSSSDDSGSSSGSSDSSSYDSGGGSSYDSGSSSDSGGGNW